MSGQERPLPPPCAAAPHAAAPSTAALSLLAAPRVLHQSSPHHAASAGQARASKGQAYYHESSNSSSGLHLFVVQTCFTVLFTDYEVGRVYHRVVKVRSKGLKWLFQCQGEVKGAEMVVSMLVYLRHLHWWPTGLVCHMMTFGWQLVCSQRKVQHTSSFNLLVH
eukprot:1141380-Pelagomonas_calceolata.AAC.6